MIVAVWVGTLRMGGGGDTERMEGSEAWRNSWDWGYLLWFTDKCTSSGGEEEKDDDNCGE